MGEQTPEVREEGMGGTGDSRGQQMGSAGGREKEEGRRGTPGGRQRGVRGGRRMEGRAVGGAGKETEGMGAGERGGIGREGDRQRTLGVRMGTGGGRK